MTQPKIGEIYVIGHHWRGADEIYCKKTDLPSEHEKLSCGTIICLLKIIEKEYGNRYFFFHIETNCKYDISENFIDLKLLD